MPQLFDPEYIKRLEDAVLRSWHNNGKRITCWHCHHQFAMNGDHFPECIVAEIEKRRANEVK